MRINRLIIKSIIFLISISFLSFAQSSSVYSGIGIGDVEYSFSSMSLGMGQTGASLAQIDNIEIINPATWYKLNHTRFNIGLYYKGLSIKDNFSSGYNDFAQIKGFTFAFPISNPLGISAAFGIAPVSKVSFKVQSNKILQASNVNITYQGTGGLSKTFIGACYKLPFDVVLGATLNYYFGEFNYQSGSNLNGQSGSNINYTRNLNPSGVGTTVGILTPDLTPLFKFKNISNLRIGFSADYYGNLRTDSLITSYSNVRTDTIGQGTANLDIPTKFTGGLSFAVNNKYLLSLDVSSQSWSKFSYAGAKSNELRNSFRAGAGFEYRPEPSRGGSFWEQIIWRAGLSYEKTPYIVNNTGINQVAISGGLSIPLNYMNYIDLDFQYALQGTTSSNLVRENIFTFNLGINLGELWFIRREF